MVKPEVKVNKIMNDEKIVYDIKDDIKHNKVVKKQLEKMDKEEYLSPEYFIFVLDKLVKNRLLQPNFYWFWYIIWYILVICSKTQGYGNFAKQNNLTAFLQRMA